MQHYVNSIYRNVVDLHIQTNEDGLHLQSRIGDWYRDTFIPALEKALLPYEDIPVVIEIPKLSIELNISYQHDFLEQMLREIIAGITSQIEPVVKEQAAKARKEDTGYSRLTRLAFYYFRHGFMPWNSPWKSAEELKQSLGNLIDGWNTEQTSKLRKITANRHAASRLIRSMPEEKIPVLLSILLSVPMVNAEKIWKDIQGFIFLVLSYSDEELLSTDVRHKRQDFLILLLTQVSGWTLSSALLSSIRQTVESSHKHRKNRSVNRPDSFSLFVSDEFRKIQPELTELLIQTGYLTVRNSAKESFNNNHIDRLLRSKQQDKPSASDISETMAKQSAEKELDQGVFTDHAGLILIAPFLPRLFDRAGIVKGNSITNPDMAVCLLHYLANGSNGQAGDIELLFSKILCGIPVDFSYDTSRIRLTPEIKSEADNLLEAVISHWAVLKKTSAEGLREAFLTRSGKISRKQKHWLLQVEQRPYDILLQQLPWNIRMIQLPWMPQMLITEWAH